MYRAAFEICKILKEKNSEGKGILEKVFITHEVSYHDTHMCMYTHTHTHTHLHLLPLPCSHSSLRSPHTELPAGHHGSLSGCRSGQCPCPSTPTRVPTASLLCLLPPWMHLQVIHIIHTCVHVCAPYDVIMM